MNATHDNDFLSFDPLNTASRSCPRRFSTRLLAITLGAVSLVSVAGCGGGGGGGGFAAPSTPEEADEAFLRAPKLTPANGDEDVQPADLEIVAEFDEAIDPTSIDLSTFALETAGGEPIPGRHAVEDNVVRFIPDAFVVPELAEIRLRLVNIRGASGKQLREEIAASFETEQYDLIRVNFQSELAEVPDGNLRDFGLASDLRREADSGAGFIYGWLDETGEPLDKSASGGEDGSFEDPRLGTFVRMQDGETDGSWQIELPAGSYQVTVAIGAGNELDDFGAQAITVEGQVAIASFIPDLIEEPFAIATIEVTVVDVGLTLAPTGGEDTKIHFVEIRRLERTRFAVNFQKEDAEVPFGDLMDFGQPLDQRFGLNQGSSMIYGWVVAGTTEPLDLVGEGRDRDNIDDQRLDTFMHMQQSAEGSWEMRVPSGRYRVRLVVGEPGPKDSVHRITVEGVLAIDDFIPSNEVPHAEATVEVEVLDGFLTIDPLGGVNTKLDFVEIEILDLRRIE